MDTVGDTVNSDKNDNDKTTEKVDEVMERDEIVKMWKDMDEKLEQKARSHNLTAVNVKSILHHMIKNPQVISTILGLDKEAPVADLKLTRSKTKHLPVPGQGMNNEHEKAPIPRALRTFLDIDYTSNEDDDDDYLPEQDEDASEKGVESELDAREISMDTSDNSQKVVTNDDVAPALHTRSKQQSNDVEEMPNFGDDILLYTAVDDPEYVEFIASLNDPSKYDIDEAEDPEYIFPVDADVEDIREEYELRKDRATEIPMREVENLLQDLLESRLLPSPEHVEQNIEGVLDENTKEYNHYRAASEDSKQKANKTTTNSVAASEQPKTPKIVLVDATEDDFFKISHASASLMNYSLDNPPPFTFYELNQLVVQLQKHVQLLTQFVVSCRFEGKEMCRIFNRFQLMINELYEISNDRPNCSFFDVSNLRESVITCHDAVNCETISDFVSRPKSFRKLQLPLPEAMFVLSRSKALLFPELLPEVRMKEFPTFYQYFTREEECLLALGLYQFGHVKRTANELQNRYALIKEHCLPNKRQSQIRFHLKNFRFSKHPIHTLFERAENESVDMIFPLENGSTACSGPPFSWPEYLQPKWLQELLRKQQDGLQSENYIVDGLAFEQILPNSNSPPSLSLNSEHTSVIQHASRSQLDTVAKSTPIASPINDDVNSEDDGNRNEGIIIYEEGKNGTRGKKSITNEAISRVTASTNCENIDSSPVHNLLYFASTVVCNEAVAKPSPPSSLSSLCLAPLIGSPQSSVKPNSNVYNEEIEKTSSPPASLSSFCSSSLSGSSRSSVSPSSNEIVEVPMTKTTTILKPGRLAPFKKISTQESPKQQCDSDRSNSKTEREVSRSPESRVLSEGEIMSNSSESPSCSINPSPAKQSSGTSPKNMDSSGVSEGEITSNSSESRSSSANSSREEQSSRIPSRNDDGDAGSGDGEGGIVPKSSESRSGFMNSSPEKPPSRIPSRNDNSVDENDDNDSSLLSGADPECCWSADDEDDGTEESGGEKSHRNTVSAAIGIGGKNEEICSNTEFVNGADHGDILQSRLSSYSTQKAPDSLGFNPEDFCDLPQYSSPVYISNNFEQSSVLADNWISTIPNAKTGAEQISPVRSLTVSPQYSSSPVLLKKLQDKDVQCNLIASESFRITRAVQCSETDFEKDSEETGERKQGQNKETDTNEGENQSTKNTGNNDAEHSEQQSGSADADGGTGGDGGEDDGGGGSGGEKENDRPLIDEILRRRRVRTRKERLRDGLCGMLNAQHRARQVKCMARVIFNDFRQRMFMYQDKIRAICELIAEGVTSSEAFEKLQDIFGEEHEPLYHLFSLIFPQNLLSANVIGNPVRNAYAEALEMIYNIEAFILHGNSKLTARAVFRAIRDLGPDCSAEAFATRLAAVIGSEGPLWEIISRNLPSHLCQINPSRADYEYVDLSNWKEDEIPYENVDLTSAMGAENVKWRSGVFVGFLRSLYTERKGKLYEVVAEWEPTEHTPPVQPESKSSYLLRRRAARRVRRRRNTKPKKTRIKTSAVLAEVPDVSRPFVPERTDDVLSVIPSKKNLTTLRLVRKRPTERSQSSLIGRKRKRDEVKLAESKVTPIAKKRIGLEQAMDSDKSEKDGFGIVAGVLPENAAECVGTSKIGREEKNPGEATTNQQATANVPTPIMPEAPERNWTVDEDRKILYTYKEIGADWERTLSQIRSVLPGIPVDELQQRLIFLLGLLERAQQDSPVN